MEPTEENIRAWNERHRRWAEVWTALPELPDEVRALLPELESRHVLHLRCGTGETAAELAAAGALVTGVDADEDALAAARQRAPSALFLRADVEELPAQLRRRRFDLVFGGPGLLDTLHDLDAWATGVASALRAGGELLLHERHPLASCLDPASLRWRADYFELPWLVGDLVRTVVHAGLTILRLEELRPTAAPRVQDPRVPGSLALVARKPL